MAADRQKDPGELSSPDVSGSHTSGPDVAGAFVMQLEDWKTLEKSYVRLTRWRRISAYLFPVIFVLFLGGGAYLMQSDPVIGGILVGYALVIPLIRYGLAPYMSRRQYRRSGLADASITFKANASTFTYTTPNSDAELRWPMVRRVSRADGCSFLWLTGRQAFIIPDRAFATESDRDALLAIANDKVVEQPI